MHPLLDGLEHVHDAGFIHRDVKPGTSSGDCVRRVRRGGNATSGSEEIRSAARGKGRRPGVGVGLRVARDL